MHGNVDLFKADMTKGKLSVEELFQKYIVDGSSYYFSSIRKDIDKEYEIKLRVADYLNIHIHEVIIVGSAKLGFSLNPKNLFNPFDHRFKQTNLNKDKSDIDIAVVSPEFFERIGKEIFNFTDAFKAKWEENLHYDAGKAGRLKIPICYKFFEYFSKGWFRIDYKPNGFELSEKSTFEVFKGEFKKDTGRKIGLGIYKDWFYFKHYHMNNIKFLDTHIKTDTL